MIFFLQCSIVDGDSTDFAPLINECNQQIKWVMHIGDKEAAGAPILRII